MDFRVKSKKTAGKEYFFTDVNPGDVAKSFSGNFAFDFSKRVECADELRAVVRDCAHPEMRAAYEEDGFSGLQRYLTRSGLKNSLVYVCTREPQ